MLGNERILKYVICFLLCIVVSLVFTAMKRSGAKHIVRDSLIMLGYILGGLLALGLVVHILGLLK